VTQLAQQLRPAHCRDPVAVVRAPGGWCDDADSQGSSAHVRNPAKTSRRSGV
jgi:hypothetical protein